MVLHTHARWQTSVQVGVRSHQSAKRVKHMDLPPNSDRWFLLHYQMMNQTSQSHLSLNRCRQNVGFDSHLGSWTCSKSQSDSVLIARKSVSSVLRVFDEGSVRI